MSKNKLSKFAEVHALPNVVEVPYAELLKGPYKLQGKWSSQFFGNDFPIVLELGCGKGEYTVGLAENFPEKNFIGIDIKGSRIWTGATAAHKSGLKNVGFIRTYVELLPSFFGPNEVSEIWITFPDPQMKKGRKRLTSTKLLAHYGKVMKPGGTVHLKTDSNFLYQYTSALVHLNGFKVESETDDLYASAYADEIMGIKTYYEQQWLSRGLTIKYLKFIPHFENLIEPDVEIEWDEYRSFGREQRSRVVGGS
ncbi:MAG: tRNA (guanosine(46)-N7)-methyltransferase TrmB [Prolixibacteraceae bacterium]|jgi:tRNA (guanine-N7-)-methyltransferase|nr:tRNA (guanosine(46)-N7)-methyltransferase TrmB [Prolixibacteraceae bacterium]